MKDPLQMTRTPFEVLNVEPGASKADIRKALVEVLAAGRISANEAKRAFDALCRPLEQAKRLILQYPAEGLGRLIPNPMKDSSILSPARRADTAQAWQRHLCKTFPDLLTTHCLAVLWYWWSLYEEQRIKALIKAAPTPDVIAKDTFTKHNLIRTVRMAEGVTCDPTDNRNCPHGDCPWLGDCQSSAPTLEEMWHRVISYWGALASAPEFWSGWPGLSDAEVNELQRTFVNSLHQELVALSQYYSQLIETSKSIGAKDELAELPDVGADGARALRRAGICSLNEVIRGGIRQLSGILDISLERAQEILAYARGTMLSDSSLPRQYRALDLLLATEIETAAAIAKVGMRTRRGSVHCGALMLRNLGLIDAVQGKVRDTLQLHHNNKGLQKLCGALSQYFSIAVLIANDKPVEALQAIEYLPENQSHSSEVLQLKVQALDLLAEQQESLGHIEDALVSWAKILTQTNDKDIKQRTRDKIVSLCKSCTAEAIRSADLERVIPVIEMAQKIVDHKDLQLALGELVYQRAINKYKSLQEGRDGLRRVILQPDLPDLRKILADLRRAEQLGIYSARGEADFVEKLIQEMEL